jgi:ABC-2 type transport system ATP-binding protein
MLMNVFGATGGRAEVLGVDSTQIRGKFFTFIGYVSENQQIPEWMRVGSFLSFPDL